MLYIVLLFMDYLCHLFAVKDKYVDIICFVNVLGFMFDFV